MKRLFIILASVTFFVSSCEKPVVENDLRPSSESFDNRVAIWKGHEVPNLERFPVDLINAESVDLMGYYSNVRSKTINNLRENSLDKKSVRETISKIYKKYPAFDKFDPENYKRYFPKMSKEEIIENRELVLSYVERLMGLDFARTFAEEGNGKLELTKGTPNARYGDFIKTAWNALTQCEVWYYAGHLRMDERGIWDAKAKSFEQQERFYGESATESDRADALRHGVWAALTGKYACYRYGSINEAASVASGFAESHECNDNSIDSKMDSHNNDFSIGYYIRNAIRVKEGLWNYNVYMDSTDDQIGSHARSAQTWQRTTINDIIWTPTSVLVYINSNPLID